MDRADPGDAPAAARRVSHLAPGSTAKFLGDPARWVDARLRFSDVHGLWGGRVVFAAGDGRVVVQSVSPAQHEARHALTAPPAEVRALLALCAEHDLLAVTGAARPILPDEVYAALTLVNAAGEARTAGCWGADAPAGFDRLLAGLAQLEARAQAAPATYRGRPEFDFAPDWFPRLR
jgi:hypothetical protein